MNFITKPLGSLLGFIYGFTNNYGFAIILFTILIRVILLPLAIKQQKSMMEQQKLQPLIAELQKKYKNDKEKLNQEMVKLYQEHKANPAAGCLLLLIQFPILIGLYRVLYKPLTYILISGFDTKLASIVKGAGQATTKAHEILQIIAENGLISVNDIAKHVDAISNIIEVQQTRISEISIAKALNLINFQFLKIDLSATPNFGKVSILWIIPILAALLTYLSNKVTSSMNKSNNTNDEKATQMQSSMMNIFPIMTLIISFTLPASLGLYWIISSLIQIIQQVFLNKYFARSK